MINTMKIMNTALISVLTATLLGFASLASGRLFDAADLIAILFTTGLVAWTMTQYNRSPRPLALARPIRLSPRVRSQVSLAAIQRQAA